MAGQGSRGGGGCGDDGGGVSGGDGSSGGGGGGGLASVQKQLPPTVQPALVGQSHTRSVGLKFKPAGQSSKTGSPCGKARSSEKAGRGEAGVATVDDRRK
jgi:hypothetical protein